MKTIRDRTANSGPTALSNKRSRHTVSPTDGQGRSRTFTGCRTCRSRHLKCDEARPTCSTCLRLNLDCEGYEPRLLWVAEQQDEESSAKSSKEPSGLGSHRAASYRYPLFTESARDAMSKELVDSLGKRTCTDALQQVDALEEPSTACRMEGPFGVFWLRSLPSPERISSPDSLPAVVGPNFALERDMEEADEEIIPDNLHLVSDSSFDPNLQPMFHQSWTDDDESLDNSLFDDFMTSGLFMYSTPRSPRTPLAGGIMSPALSTRGGSRSHYAISRPHARVPSRIPSPMLPMSSTIPRDFAMPPGRTKNGMSVTLPPSAAPLLRFYKNDVLEATTSSLKARTSLWNTLIVPRALETFAELSLWNEASHTRCAIFFCLLAQAALRQVQSPDVNPTSAMEWSEVARNHQHQAQEHLKKALQFEFDGDDKADYTDLVTAMLATAIVSIHFHGSTIASAVLVDVERLIRLRSRPVRETYNARMLHHTYTHLRVLMESTRLPSHPSPQKLQDSSIADAQPDTCPGNGNALLRHFSLGKDSLGTDLDLTMEKPPDIGYSDIHLEISGSWPATLYPEIFGLPESLVTLLSQTVSLANSKPHLDTMAAGDPGMSQALSQHVKKLEQNIWSWTVESTPNLPSGPGRPDNLFCVDTKLWEHPQTRCMILAMHQALIIYFYRMIYQMSAMVIQDAVRKAVDYLEECIDAFVQDQDFASTVAWCSFITACEAIDPALQEKALACLRKTDDIGTVLTTQKPSEVAAAVWQRRRQTGDWTYSWLDHSMSLPQSA
ncbi:fungal-specific transcription factor domain-containing protein [Plectosphaerella plurivora]|uniref:Fungal-specific transcription factor domain-containing protein n=1 Tax=Plectosphaerella plurivora TaxID=936078 RepID=A0A9P8UZZ7_9PEZI|nr:fungal-specific transcription factor domain-containing protein [Plectosphaerella plurivora]